MKRRSFLAMLGLAPIVQAVPAAVAAPEGDGGAPSSYVAATGALIGVGLLHRFDYSFDEYNGVGIATLQVRATESDEWADTGVVLEMTLPVIDDVTVRYA